MRKGKRIRRHVGTLDMRKNLGHAKALEGQSPWTCEPCDPASSSCDMNRLDCGRACPPQSPVGKAGLAEELGRLAESGRIPHGHEREPTVFGLAKRSSGESVALSWPPLSPRLQKSWHLSHLNVRVGNVHGCDRASVRDLPTGSLAP